MKHFLDPSRGETVDDYLDEDSEQVSRKNSDRAKKYRREALLGWAAGATVSGVASGKELAYDAPQQFGEFYGTNAWVAVSDEIVAGSFFAFAAYYCAKRASRL